MKKKILAVITLNLAMVLGPVLANQAKSNQEIEDLTIVDFHKETLMIPYVLVKNLDPEIDGQCFAVEMIQNGSANTWKVDKAELVECPPEVVALSDSPDESPADSPDDSNSNGELEDDDSEADDSIKDDSVEDDAKEDDSKEDDSRDNEAEDDEMEDEESTAY